MKFSNGSDVTLVVTSCGRFELLSKTLVSFFENNTYPLKEVIVIEDSCDERVVNYIPQDIIENTKIIVNTENIGQIASIDKAYSKVTTDFIFHCEDDWEFTRGGFIEDSMSIMSNKKIVTVQLRDIYLDMLENYSFHFVSDELESNGGIIYHHLLSTSSWKGFTFNPSLKRIEDYKIIGKYYRDGMNAGETELFLSNFYDAIGMATAILKKPAVKHIGWDSHVYSDNEKDIIKKEKERKLKKKIKDITIGIILGGLGSFLLSKIGW